MRRLSLLVALLALLGCGAGTSTSDETLTTPESLAALLVQYLPQTPTKAYAVRDAGKVATKVEFATGAVMLSVLAVAPGDNDLVRKICEGCDITELDDGSTLHITRGDRLPGVGLGETAYVRVSLFRDDETIELTYEGTPIRVSGKAEGNNLDVEGLVEIIQDPNLGVRTVSGLLDDGEALSFWDASP